MRAVTFTLGLPVGPHIAARMFGPETAFERDQVYQLNVLEDGTVVLLGTLRGDLEAARELLDADDSVLGYSITQSERGHGLAYVHAEPPPSMERFLLLPRTHEVFFDFPLASTSDGRLRIQMLGESNDVLRAALANLPPTLDVTIERIGPYPAPGDHLLNLLTDRQREVLAIALDLGYYEVPRQATHRDIADRLDISVGTVGEHLQKIESRVFNSIQP